MNAREQELLDALKAALSGGWQNIRLNFTIGLPTEKNEDIAAVLQISMRKIDRVKKRFVEEGFERVLGGRKVVRRYRRKADGDFEAHLIAISCSKPPAGYSRWSLRLLADRVVELEYIESVSYETIRRVLKKRNKTMEEAKLGHTSGSKR